MRILFEKNYSELIEEYNKFIVNNEIYMIDIYS
jgi:hypothetical protein